MDSEKPVGNIALIGFEILEPTEIDSINKIVAVCMKKLSENRSFNELRLKLRQHAHGKSFKHEIEGFAIIGKNRITASVTEWNLYKAVSEVCEKLYSGSVHKIKKDQSHNKKHN